MSATSSVHRYVPWQSFYDAVTGLVRIRGIVKVLVAQLGPTLCDPMDCSPPGSSVHEIFQARILEWVAISISRGLPDPGIELWSPTLWADSLPSEPPGEYSFVVI